jgi:hypothetical protein
VLASDDPGVYGYLDLSFDFFEAAMSFGLDLPAFKKLAMNSFNYSGLDAVTVGQGLALWQKKWNTFIDATKAEACKPAGAVLTAPVRLALLLAMPLLVLIRRARFAFRTRRSSISCSRIWGRSARRRWSRSPEATSRLASDRPCLLCAACSYHELLWFVGSPASATRSSASSARTASRSPVCRSA